jgi:hypothetical protein
MDCFNGLLELVGTNCQLGNDHLHGLGWHLTERGVEGGKRLYVYWTLWFCCKTRQCGQFWAERLTFCLWLLAYLCPPAAVSRSTSSSSYYACEVFIVVTLFSLCYARVWGESSSFWAQWKPFITVKVVSCLMTLVGESPNICGTKHSTGTNGNMLQHFVGWLCDLWRKHRPPPCPAYHMLCFLRISRDSAIGRAIEFGLEDWIIARIKDICLLPRVHNTFGGA